MHAYYICIRSFIFICMINDVCDQYYIPYYNYDRNYFYPVRVYDRTSYEAYHRLSTIIFQWWFHYFQSFGSVVWFQKFPLWVAASIWVATSNLEPLLANKKIWTNFPSSNSSNFILPQRLDNFHKKIRRSYDGEIKKKNWWFVCVKKVWDLLNKYMQKINILQFVIIPHICRDNDKGGRKHWAV